MRVRVEASLEQSVQQILDRVRPCDDRLDLERFLTNIELIIKRARGEPLSEAERLYPGHARISCASRDTWRWLEGEYLERRLDLVDRLELTDAQRVIDLMLSDWYLPPYPAGLRLTGRQARVLAELHQNPLLTTAQLAQRLGPTPRTIRHELRQLASYFGLRVVYKDDPQRFKLAHMLIHFQTRSLSHSQRLEQHYRGANPLFLNALVFDEDYQHGYLTYVVPDQPKGHRLFESRLQQLREEYFEDDRVDRIRGISVFTSFDAYDPASGAWLPQSHMVSETALQFLRNHGWVIPRPPSLFYGDAMSFSREDFLLAELVETQARPIRISFIQEQLRHRGFNLAKKTIYTRLQALRQAGALQPFTYFEAPSFESFVTMYIQCNDDSRNTIGLLAHVFPFAFVCYLDHGLTIHFQQPTHCSSLTGHLVRTLSRDQDVTHVIVVTRSCNLGSASHLGAFERWDESHQRWLLLDSDI